MIRRLMAAATIPMLLTASAAAHLLAASPSTNAHWRLPARVYPAHAQISHFRPSNRDILFYFGALHRSRYGQLGRRNGEGWVQVGELERDLTTGGGRTSARLLLWVYGVSYYPSMQTAERAANDFVRPLAPSTDTGEYGGTYAATAGGEYASYAALGRGRIVVEQFCGVPVDTHGRNRRLLDRYCSVQRAALERILTAQAQGTVPTPAPGVVSGFRFQVSRDQLGR